MRRHINDYPRRGVGLDTQYTWPQVLIVMFQEMKCFIGEETVWRCACPAIVMHGPAQCRARYTFLCSGENAMRSLQRILSQLHSLRVATSIPLMMKKFRADASLWELVVNLREMKCVTEMIWKWFLFRRMLRSKEIFVRISNYQALHDGSLAMWSTFAWRFLMRSDWWNSTRVTKLNVPS